MVDEGVFDLRIRLIEGKSGVVGENKRPYPVILNSDGRVVKLSVARIRRAFESHRQG